MTPVKRAKRRQLEDVDAETDEEVSDDEDMSEDRGDELEE